MQCLKVWGGSDWTWPDCCRTAAGLLPDCCRTAAGMSRVNTSPATPHCTPWCPPSSGTSGPRLQYQSHRLLMMRCLLMNWRATRSRLSPVLVLTANNFRPGAETLLAPGSSMFHVRLLLFISCCQSAPLKSEDMKPSQDITKLILSLVS